VFLPRAQCTAPVRRPDIDAVYLPAYTHAIFPPLPLNTEGAGIDGFGFDMLVAFGSDIASTGHMTAGMGHQRVFLAIQSGTGTPQ